MRWFQFYTRKLRFERWLFEQAETAKQVGPVGPLEPLVKVFEQVERERKRERHIAKQAERQAAFNARPEQIAERERLDRVKQVEQAERERKQKQAEQVGNNDAAHYWAEQAEQGRRQRTADLAEQAAIYEQVEREQAEREQAEQAVKQVGLWFHLWVYFTGCAVHVHAYSDRASAEQAGRDVLNAYGHRCIRRMEILTRNLPTVTALDYQLSLDAYKR